MPECPVTPQMAHEIAELLGELGYHVTYGKPMYALADWLKKLAK